MDQNRKRDDPTIIINVSNAEPNAVLHFVLYDNAARCTQSIAANCNNGQCQGSAIISQCVFGHGDSIFVRLQADEPNKALEAIHIDSGSGGCPSGGYGVQFHTVHIKALIVTNP